MRDSNLENDILYFYRGLDVKDLRNCNEEEINEINERGYDIFWCLQKFKDRRRVKDNLEFFKWVGADFDDITWGELQQRLKNFPKPTMAITTRSGVHCYWKLKTPIKGSDKFCEAYREFIARALVPLGADTNARDVCRILRAPMYRYWQDSEGTRYEDKEIRIELIYDNGPEWEWEGLERLFKGRNHVAPGRENIKTSVPNIQSDEGGFWAKANGIPVIEGLQSFSGKSYVRGESYAFRKESTVTRIIINGKESNAWIDKSGRIGSLHTNGSIPVAGTIVNWLSYSEYGLDMKQIASILKREFGI